MSGGPMYVEGWHPGDPHQNLQFSGEARYFHRTQRPPKYCLIDFGISQFYDYTQPAMDLIHIGGDKSPPEHQKVWTGQINVGHADPFPTDVYVLAHVIEDHFFRVSDLRSEWKNP
jgi:hypothetical protein